MCLNLWAIFNLHHHGYLLRYFGGEGKVKGFGSKSLTRHLKVKIVAWHRGAQKIYLLITWINYDERRYKRQLQEKFHMTLTLERRVFFSSSEVFSETLEKWEIPEETDSVDLSFSNKGQKDLEHLYLKNPAACIKPVLFLGRKLVNLESDYCWWWNSLKWKTK